MDGGLIALFAGVGLLVGLLIGSVGIGGVLLAPALVYLGGIEVHVAVATAMWVFLFSGVLATALFARRGSIDWRMAGWLCLGAMPAAFAGALTMAALPGRLLELVIAGFVIFSGARALARQIRPASAGQSRHGWKFVGVGAVTGFGSALSGTGGPLILLPILIWLKLPVLAAVGLGQAIQIPVSALGTAGNLIGGYVDSALGAAIALVVMAGVTIGTRIAHAVSAVTLARAVAVVLIFTGIFMAARIVWP
jgi:hypothetical protein